MLFFHSGGGKRVLKGEQQEEEEQQDQLQSHRSTLKRKERRRKNSKKEAKKHQEVPKEKKKKEKKERKKKRQNTKKKDKMLLTTALSSLKNVLKQIGRSSSARRCSLLTLQGTDLTLLLEWLSPETPPCPCPLSVSQEECPYLFDQLHSGHKVEFHSPDDFADLPDAHPLKIRKIQALLLVPIPAPEDSSKIIGVASFDSPTPCQWTNKDAHLLEILRDLVQCVLTHPAIFQNYPCEILELGEEVFAGLSKGQKQVVLQVLDLFESLRRTSVIQDLWDGVGKAAFVTRVSRFVAADLPISLALPAFPMKNLDKEKMVLGVLPDVGELLALSNLNKFAEEVSRFYKHGAKILVISDGRWFSPLCPFSSSPFDLVNILISNHRVFNDLYTVPDDEVSTYNECIHSLFKSRYLQFIGLDELFPSMNNEEKRDAIITLYGEPIEMVQAKLKRDPHFLEVYVVFKKYLTTDLKCSKREAAERGKLMMLRNESYSHLVSLLFPHHIRLSIHDHSGTEKIGVHLVGKSIITPWHGVALKRKDSTWAIVRRREAELMGALCQDALDHENHREIVEEDLNLSVEEILSHPFLKSLPFYRE